MPNKLLRPCPASGCPELTRGGRCEKHLQQSRHESDRLRPHSGRRGYTSTHWRRLRAAILSRDGGLCVECNRHGRVEVATEVDHIVPKAQGGTNAWDNLQSLCRSCHSRKTATEQRAGS